MPFTFVNDKRPEDENDGWTQVSGHFQYVRRHGTLKALETEVKQLSLSSGRATRCYEEAQRLLTNYGVFHSYVPAESHAMTTLLGIKGCET